MTLNCSFIGCHAVPATGYNNDLKPRCERHLHYAGRTQVKLSFFSMLVSRANTKPRHKRSW